jgi:peptidoglycan/xylan/chitin deacetylase (PgdA/CDA1 family)
VATRVSLIFDDGFVRSTVATARLFEEFKLPAVFAALAEPKTFAPQFAKGDFALWNDLQSAGHIVQPHGLDHAKLTELSPDVAIEQMGRTLDLFAEKLDGFDAKRSVYCHTYNCGSPALNEWLLSRVHAVRQDGSGFMSSAEIELRIWHCTAIGPHDPGDELLELLDRAAKKRPHTFLFTLHGVDGEAWGAIASDKLRRVLERITTDDAFEYWPVRA